MKSLITLIIYLCGFLQAHAGESCSFVINEVFGINSDIRLSRIVLEGSGAVKGIKLRGFVESKIGEQEVGYLDYEMIDDFSLSINHIEVEGYARQRGLQHRLFEELIARNPEVTRIKSFFDETNSIIFHRKLIELIDPDYPIERDHSVIAIGNELTKCCSEKFHKLSKKEKDDIVEKAVKVTPAYKSRIKVGFDLCPDEWDYEFRSNSIFPGMKIILWSCKTK